MVYLKMANDEKKFNPWLTLTGVRATETNHWLRSLTFEQLEPSRYVLYTDLSEEKS